jgi:hypothetical protein
MRKGKRNSSTLIMPEVPKAGPFCSAHAMSALGH